MCTRLEAANIIPKALIIIVACVFLLNGHVLAGSKSMSDGMDKSMTSSKKDMTKSAEKMGDGKKMMDKKKSMKKAGKTMTDGSKKAMDTKKDPAKNKMMKDDSTKMMDKKDKM